MLFKQRAAATRRVRLRDFFDFVLLPFKFGNFVLE